MSRIDTGLKTGIRITDGLKKQAESFSEQERTLLLETIKNIAIGLERSGYCLDSLPESLLSGCFIIYKYKKYNISLTFSQEKEISSGYFEEELGIPIEVPKKRIIRDLKEMGYNISFVGIAPKADELPPHIKIVFTKEDMGIDFELKIYPDGVLFPQSIVFYPLSVVLDKISKKSKEALAKRKKFTNKLELPHLAQELKYKIIQYESGERDEKFVEISEYETKILDYLSELIGNKLRHSALFRFGNYTIEDKKVINIRLPRTELIEFPEIILNLENLRRLNLRTNNISTIPNEITKLKELQKLYISENSISSLPESIGNLENLSHLDLSGNQLRSLPNSIRASRNLRKLNLAFNNFEYIPEQIYYLENLEELDLLANNIKTVPERIVNLKSLKSLNFGSINMTSIPYSIGLLSDLERLNLICNDSSNLPENIGNLQLLNWLELYVDTLSTLPESFGNLNSLENLTLYSRKGTTLPLQLLELQSLRMITFTGDISNVIIHGFKNDTTTEYILDKLSQKGVGLYIP